MALLIRPWKTASDLQEVWKLFSASSSSDKRKACDIVAVWKHRSAGKMPHQILSTAALVDAQLNDRPGTSSVQSTAAVYAMAVLSFITGTADIEQTKEHKISMFDVAKGINLPARLVEIRHEIVHEGVPSLSVLREATKDALRWLDKEYWCHVVVPEKDITNANDHITTFKDTFKHVDSLLQAYRKVAAKARSREACENAAIGLMKDIQAYCDENEGRSRIVKSILAQPDYNGPEMAWECLAEQLKGTRWIETASKEPQT